MTNIALLQRELGTKFYWDVKDWLRFVDALYKDTNNDVRLKSLHDRLFYETRAPYYREQQYILEYLKLFLRENNVDKRYIDYITIIQNGSIIDYNKLIYTLSDISTNPVNPVIDLNNTVFVVDDFGQSNSIGRMTAQRIIQMTEYMEIPIGIKIYNKPDYTSADNGSFFNFQEGSGFTREPDQAVVPFGGCYGMLAQLLSKVSPNTVYIVPCGDGGTALKQNLSTPDWFEGSVDECFQTFTQYYYTVAYNKIALENPGKTIVPIILWHQGETDAGDADGTSGYRVRFTGPGRFVDSLRASHPSLANALMIITKLYYNIEINGANEAIINQVFQDYADANSNLVKIVDISDQPRKIDLTTEQKGGIATAGNDDIHTSYLGQRAKAERMYSIIKAKYFPTADDSDILTDVYNPANLGTIGVSLSFSKNKVITDSKSIITGITNDFSLGNFNGINNGPRFKTSKRKGYLDALSGFDSYITTSTAIGTALFADPVGVSWNYFIKPRDGQPPATNVIFHDIQNVSSVNNSRIFNSILTTGRLYTALAIGGVVVQAETNTSVWENGSQLNEKHIAITVTNGELIRIYIDGILQTLDVTNNGNISALNLSNYLNNTNPFTLLASKIGASTFGSYFNGIIRKFQIHKGVIYNQTQIDNLRLN